jgi:hypothetical protein
MTRACAALAFALVLVASCARPSRGQIIGAGAGVALTGAALMATAPEGDGDGGWGPAAIDAQGPIGAVAAVGGLLIMVAGASAAQQPPAAR